MVVVVEGEAGGVGQFLGIQLGAQLGFDVVQAALDDGKDVTTKSPVWLFYSKIWINMVSLRPFVFRSTELLFKNKKNESLSYLLL